MCQLSQEEFQQTQYMVLRAMAFIQHGLHQGVYVAGMEINATALVGDLEEALRVLLKDKAPRDFDRDVEQAIRNVSDTPDSPLRLV